MTPNAAGAARSRRTRIKFCGMTSAEDVAMAVEAGADAVGVIVAESPRRVALDALPALRHATGPFVSAIGVVARESAPLARELAALGFTVQFSGPELPGLCERLAGGRPYIKAFHIDPAESYDAEDFASLAAYVNATPMFDTAARSLDGGTGRTFDWHVVAPFARARRIIVSGGLEPGNVGDCVRTVRPWAVDVRSGIETGGKKDARKMVEFVRAVKEADAQT